MAVTNEEVFNWFQKNPNATDADILKAAATYNVPLSQISQVTGLPLEQAQIRTYGVLAKPPETLTQKDLEAISVNSLGKNLYAPSDVNIRNWLGQYQDAPDSVIANAMQQVGLTPAQVAAATNNTVDSITQRYNTALNSAPTVQAAAPVVAPAQTAQPFVQAPAPVVAPQQNTTGGMFGPVPPQAPPQTQNQAYSPDYFNAIQNYYSGYLPGKQINSSLLNEWYGSGNNINYGGNTYAQPVQPNPANQPNPSAGVERPSGGDSYTPDTSTQTSTDVISQMQSLNNPVAKGLLSAMPLGIGGALGGYTGATLANQLNEIVGLYGGTLGKNVDPMLGALQGFFGLTPDTTKAAGLLSGQFDDMAQYAGYMQAATDPVLGSIVNSLTNENTTAKSYGNIAAMVGQRINETLAANPGLGYEEAAALASFDMGLTSGPLTAEQSQAMADSFANSLSSDTSRTDSGFGTGDSFGNQDIGGYL